MIKKLMIIFLYTCLGIQSASVLAASTDGAQLVAGISRDENYFIIPESGQRYLSVEDISDMDTNKKQMAINEIYARRGRMFSTPEIQKYFDEKNWYSGTISPEQFSDDLLNEFERENIDFISTHMNDVVDMDATSENNVYNNLEDISSEKGNLGTEYVELYQVIGLEDLENFVGEKVKYSGSLVDIKNSTFVISGGGPQMPYITANYNESVIKDTIDGWMLEEYPVFVTVWGTLTVAGDSPQIDMDYICMGGDESWKDDAMLVDYDYFSGDIPDNVGAHLKCVGILRTDDRWKEWDNCNSKEEFLENYCDSNKGRTHILSSGKERDYLGITADLDSFVMSTNIETTNNSFSNIPVAIYGMYVGNNLMCMEYIEPLPKSEWSSEIEEMVELTQWTLPRAEKYYEQWAIDYLKDLGLTEEEIPGLQK